MTVASVEATGAVVSQESAPSNDALQQSWASRGAEGRDGDGL